MSDVNHVFLNHNINNKGNIWTKFKTFINIAKNLRFIREHVKDKCLKQEKHLKLIK